jgi:hypothetical protein
MLCASSADFNLIIKDDCSPRQKEIQNIVDSFNESLNFEVIFYKNKTNLGYDKNLLDAFRITDSQYIFLLSDDDYVDGFYIDKLIKLLSIKEYKIYFTPYIEIDKVSRLNIRPYRLSRFQDVIYNSILFSGLIFDRKAVLSLNKDESFLSTCIYTQVYLASLIIFNEQKFGEAINGLLHLGGDGANYFGMNESAINKDLLQNRNCVTSNFKYQSLLLKVVDRISEDTHHSVRSTFRSEYNLRLLSYLLRARSLGLNNYKQLVECIQHSKLNVNWYVRMFMQLFSLLPGVISMKLLLLGHRFLKRSG